MGKTGDKGERRDNVRGRREEPEGARKEAKGGGQTKEWDGTREPGRRNGIRDERREEGGRMREEEEEVGVQDQVGGWGE